MIVFLADCAGLFNSIFDAVWEIPIFKLLLSWLLISALIWLFMYLGRGARKM